MRQTFFRSWPRLIPYFISAAFFLSGFFTVFAPLPLLLLGVSQGVVFAGLALLINAALIYLVSGPAIFQFYLVFVGTAGILIPWLLLARKWSLEKVTGVTWIAQLGVLVLLFAVYAMIRNHGFLDEIKEIVGGLFDLFLSSLAPETRDRFLGEMTELEWRRKTLMEFPFSMGMASLALVWMNLYLLIGFNPKQVLSRRGITREALYRWKTADWVIWPTLATWLVVLLSHGPVFELSLGLLKLFMAIYAIQGIVILSAAFNAWRIKGFYRVFAFMVALLFMVPLLLGLGFFDQWFDFRAKFRQS